MNASRGFLIGLLASLLFCSLALYSCSGEEVKLLETNRCAVCGMYVDQYPNWMSSIVFRDGERVLFDGPKCMFGYYLDVSKYEKEKSADDVSEVFVTDYYSTKPIPAREAFFVVGSDVRGPMGKELVPLADRTQAETFLKDHNGETIVEFDQVTVSVISELQ